tara:strand:- start:649 stop:1092 length:444 start_codon:yes stop_codon:yes gene_type:complete
MRGLFARRDLVKGELLCTYDGEVLASSEANYFSEYFMTARNPQDLRRRLVIDGDPDRFENLAGYANFAAHEFANGIFMDETTRGGVRPYVCLRARVDTAKGTEIRVDYDMGSAGHPYRDMMEAHAQWSVEQDDTYRKVVWDDPPDLF